MSKKKIDIDVQTETDMGNESTVYYTTIISMYAVNEREHNMMIRI
jgi:hypothetical protein